MERTTELTKDQRQRSYRSETESSGDDDPVVDATSENGLNDPVSNSEFTGEIKVRRRKSRRRSTRRKKAKDSAVFDVGETIDRQPNSTFARKIAVASDSPASREKNIVGKKKQAIHWLNLYESANLNKNSFCKTCWMSFHMFLL